MKYTIEGFNQEEMVRLGMDCVDACILRWFIDFKDSGRMTRFNLEDGNEYYWINYQSLIEDMPLIGIHNKEVLYRRLKNMKVLKHFTLKKKGTYSGYNIDIVVYNLLISSIQKSNPIDSKVEPPIDSKVEPKDSSTKLNSSTKIHANIKKVLPNNVEEVIEYFVANGYSQDLAERFYNYYSVADWCDREGKKVLRWKQKAQVWFKPENKTIENINHSQYNKIN